MRPPHEKRGGRRADWRDVSNVTQPLLAAWRLSARRPATFRRRAALSATALAVQPSAGSRRGVLVSPGGAPTPPERVSLLAHARGRRSEPHEPAQPVRVPHGSGHEDYMPVWEIGDKLFLKTLSGWEGWGNLNPSCAGACEGASP